ncbi:MAG: hypothetical protein NZ749_03530 [bacterium]|nr:hypothetical protein [bacterium]
MIAYPLPPKQASTASTPIRRQIPCRHSPPFVWQVQTCVAEQDKTVTRLDFDILLRDVTPECGEYSLREV